MPLNLLQHKSWHVGSAKNQERVRRDEKEAQLREEEEERRIQLADADHRLHILRQRMRAGQTGDDVSLQLDPTAPTITTATTSYGSSATASATTSTRTTHGGNSTSTEPERDGSKKRRRETERYSSDAPLTGPDGHINLFPPEALRSEPRKKQQRKEDEADALQGVKLERPSEPWYSTVDKVSEADKAKDERLRRREEKTEKRVREEQDPLKAMKFGLQKLREVRSEVASERRRRDADVGMGFGLERRVHSKHGKHRDRDDDHHNKDRQKQRQRQRHRRSRSPRQKDDCSKKEDDSLRRLREERIAREAAEREKARVVVDQEMASRKPERWTASATGGRGKYSRQFGE